MLAYDPDREGLAAFRKIAREVVQRGEEGAPG